MIAGLDEPDDGVIACPRAARSATCRRRASSRPAAPCSTRRSTPSPTLLALERECRALEEQLAHTPADDPEHDALLAAYTPCARALGRRGQLRPRERGRAGARRPRLLDRRPRRATPASSPAAGRCASRSPSCCCAGPTCCCSTSRPTISTSRRATGSRRSSSTYPDTVILVAHDRYFLDVTVNRITEVPRGKLTDYQRQLQPLSRRARGAARARRCRPTSTSRRRSSASRRSSAASATRPRRRRWCRAASSSSRRSSACRRPTAARATHPLPLSGRARSGRDRAASCEQRAEALRRPTRLRRHRRSPIERGRKVALVGPNGAGKSTLHQAARRRRAAERRRAPRRPQRHARLLRPGPEPRSLDPERTVLDEATAAAPIELVPQVRNLLGAFLFSGDSVRQARQGAERRRAQPPGAGASCCCEPANCLLLDEPTNHLDIDRQGGAARRAAAATAARSSSSPTTATSSTSCRTRSSRSAPGTRPLSRQLRGLSCARRKRAAAGRPAFPTVAGDDAERRDEPRRPPNGARPDREEEQRLAPRGGTSATSRGGKARGNDRREGRRARRRSAR